MRSFLLKAAIVLLSTTVATSGYPVDPAGSGLRLVLTPVAGGLPSEPTTTYSVHRIVPIDDVDPHPAVTTTTSHNYDRTPTTDFKVFATLPATNHPVSYADNQLTPPSENQLTPSTPLTDNQLMPTTFTDQLTPSGDKQLEMSPINRIESASDSNHPSSQVTDPKQGAQSSYDPLTDINHSSDLNVNPLDEPKEAASYKYMVLTKDPTKDDKFHIAKWSSHDDDDDVNNWHSQPSTSSGTTTIGPVKHMSSDDFYNYIISNLITPDDQPGSDTQVITRPIAHNFDDFDDKPSKNKNQNANNRFPLHIFHHDDDNDDNHDFGYDFKNDPFFKTEPAWPSDDSPTYIHPTVFHATDNDHNYNVQPVSPVISVPTGPTRPYVMSPQSDFSDNDNNHLPTRPNRVRPQTDYGNNDYYNVQPLVSPTMPTPPNTVRPQNNNGNNDFNKVQPSSPTKPSTSNPSTKPKKYVRPNPSGKNTPSRTDKVVRVNQNYVDLVLPEDDSPVIDEKRKRARQRLNPYTLPKDSNFPSTPQYHYYRY